MRILYAYFASVMALAPTAARCGNIVTNSAELLPHLGHDGREGVEFALDATVVSDTNPFSKDFFVKTANGYIKLVDKALWPGCFLRAGDMIKVRGLTVRGTNSTEDTFVRANCCAIDIIGHTVPDPPIDATIDDVLAGMYNFRLIRIRGTVRDVFLDEIQHRYQHVIVSSGTRSVGLVLDTLSCRNHSPEELIGAGIQATGYYTPNNISGARKLNRSEISTRNVNIISPPPEDPFSVPSIESIPTGGETAAIMNLGRHSASGTVVAVWQRNNFAIRTASGAIVNISLSDGPPPSCGDVVDVAGLPDTDLYRINLRRAIWRMRPGTAKQEPEKAEPMEASALFREEHGHYDLNPHLHGRAVSLRGLVTGVPSTSLNDGIVRLLCGDFTVTINASSTPDAIKGLKIGSKVEISGTCIVLTDSWHPNEPVPRIRDVILVVRTPADIKILTPPPWWTPRRFLVLIAALLATLAAFLLWNVILRRLADKRGRELMRSRLSQEESKLKIQERTRIAVELHDTIAQNLTGVSMEIDSAEQLAAKDFNGMMKHLGMASKTLQSCRNELRNCLWDLRSRALEETDLNEAIRRTVAPLVSNVDLAIRFNVPRKALADDTVHVLMRIVRELVQNAVRHGEASLVKIAGSLDDGILRFSVRDNGCGFDPATRPGVLQGHFGLQGISERINQFNGDIQMESSPGNGTKVSISMKL